jgi:hypothetical protein
VPPRKADRTREERMDRTLRGVILKDGNIEME